MEFEFMELELHTYNCVQGDLYWRFKWNSSPMQFFIYFKFDL